MVDTTNVNRRTLLKTAGGAVGAAALGLAGASASSGRGPTEPASIPVIDNSAGTEGQTVSVLVTVVDESGAPVAGEPVELEDRGGTPDDRLGETGPAGTVLFLESVGPPPCNTQTVTLPERGQSAALGCNNGGVHLEQTFQLDGGDDVPVVDNGSDDSARNVTVDVEVVDESGAPVAGEPVELEDRGGTPDDRLGETGPDGRLRFVENVGPEPCNTQTLKLPERGQSAALGCNNGGTELSHTFEVGGGDDVPVVDNGSDDPVRNVTVDVEVVDTNGDPVEGEPVELEDRGGTPDDRLGETGPNGRLRFVESVGPAPCNTQTLKLPERGQSAALGCNNGGAELSHTFEVGGGQASTPEQSTDRFRPMWQFFTNLQ